ncbi:MAG: glycosyltransferase family 39 protein [Candidatus Moranbacteria bacterium]|nr:glycosyltransferase family 39 protein [Candidatus Moranbacteria bacterium]MDX9855886.1 glycosyltransferase family 39 protein [Candidatus Moranbacteria bacterium]
MLNKIKKTLGNTFFLTILSTVLATNSYFFIERKSTNAFPLIFDNIKIHYLIYMVGFLSLVFYLYLSKNKRLLEGIKKINLILLPTEIVFILGLFVIHDTTTVHYVFYIFTGIYIIFNALLFIHKKGIEPKRKNRLDAGSWIKKQGIAYIFALILSLSTFGYFGIKDIENYAGVDEPLWTFDRIPSFWRNVMERDWKNTSISDKPGITVVEISGIGLLFSNPMEYADLESFNPEKDIRIMNKAFRLPLVIFCLISLLAFYILIQELLNKKIAILSVALISTAPILVGISRIINPDAILWVFAPLSIISYLIFLEKRNCFWLYVTGILLGLSILTKYVANIIYIFLFSLVFLEYIFGKKEDTKKEDFRAYLKKSFFNLISVILISLITFYIIFPETWVDPKKLFTGTIMSQAFSAIAPIFASILIFLMIDFLALKAKIIKVIFDFGLKKRKLIAFSILAIFSAFMLIVFVNTYLSMKFIDFESILSSPKTSYRNSPLFFIFSANFYPLFFASLPIVILGVSYSLICSFRKITKINKESKIIIYFIFFILAYYLGTTFNGVVSTIRYQVMLYPLLLIISAIGLHGIMKSIEKKIAFRNVFMFFLTALLIAGIFTLYKAKPFYLGYASILLPDKYIVDTKDMGDGSYEAAQYLNSLSNAEKMFVWTDKKGVCSFFVGKCDSFYDQKSFEKNEVDYFVLSSGRESKFVSVGRGRPNLPYDFSELYASSDYEFFIAIGERPGNYVKIISAEKFKK